MAGVLQLSGDRVHSHMFFTAWCQVIADQACEKFAGKIRRNLSSAMGSVSARWANGHAIAVLAEVWASWSEVCEKSRLRSRSVCLKRICWSQASRNADLFMEVYFIAWLLGVSRNMIHLAMRNNAELSYWAQLHLLARIVLHRWSGQVLLGREVRGNLTDLGRQRAPAIRALILRAASCNDSELLRTCLIVWSRHSRRAYRAAAGVVDQYTLQVLVARTATRMMSGDVQVLARTAWRLWTTACRHSAHVADLEHGTDVLGSNGLRRDALLGTMLLVWAQEQTLSFAHLALVAWGQHVGRTARTAASSFATAALIAERQAATAKMNSMAVKALAGFIQEGLTLAFTAWKQSCEDERVRRSNQQLLLNGAGTIRRVRAAIQLTERWQNVNNNVHTVLGMLGAMTAWQRYAFELRHPFGKAPSEQASAYLLRARKLVRTAVAELVCRERSREAHLMFSAWVAATEASGASEVMDAVRAGCRLHSLRACGGLVERSAPRESAVMLAATYTAWQAEVLQWNQEHWRDRLQAWTRRTGMPCLATHWWCLVCWKASTLFQLRLKLLQDGDMMVALLHDSSATIEALRLRLLSVRIYGAVRRKVLETWRQLVVNGQSTAVMRTRHVLQAVRSVGDDGGTPGVARNLQYRSTAHDVVASPSPAKALAAAAVAAGISAHERGFGPTVQAPLALAMSPASYPASPAVASSNGTLDTEVAGEQFVEYNGIRLAYCSEQRLRTLPVVRLREQATNLLGAIGVEQIGSVVPFQSDPAWVFDDGRRGAIIGWVLDVQQRFLFDAARQVRRRGAVTTPQQASPASNGVGRIRPAIRSP